MGTPSRGTSAESSYTSYVNGQTLPGALNIELNLPVRAMATPEGGSINIYGVSKEEISQSQDLIGAEIEVWGGMRKGLPLANPLQSQMPLIMGRINQAFGNWQGTDQILGLFFTAADVGRSGDNKNFSFMCKANQSLADAIKTTMRTAIPGCRVDCFISSDVKWDYDQQGVFGSLATFCQQLKVMTNTQRFAGIKTVLGLPYGGVECFLKPGDNKFYVFYDNTVPMRGGKAATSGAGTGGQTAQDFITNIDFADLIGQPTWFGPNQIQFKTVMRSDVSIGDIVRLPRAVAAINIQTPKSSPTIEQGSATQFVSRNKTTFEGKFGIQSVNHYGNFRQPDGDSWVSVFTAVFLAQEAKIPEGTVTVGEPTHVDPNKARMPIKINEQQTPPVNTTPPNVVNTQILSGFPAAQQTQSPTAPQPGDSVSGPFLRNASVPSMQGLVVRNR